MDPNSSGREFAHSAPPSQGSQSPEQPPAGPIGTRIVTFERSITRPASRPISTFAGAVQIRKEIALALLDDGIAWAKRVFQASAEDPTNQYLGNLAHSTLELILNKTIGQPKEPYDEVTGPSPGTQTDRIILQEAQKVLQGMESSPLDKYLAVAEKGIVKLPPPADGESNAESGH